MTFSSHASSRRFLTPLRNSPSAVQRLTVAYVGCIRLKPKVLCYLNLKFISGHRQRKFHRSLPSRRTDSQLRGLCLHISASVHHPSWSVTDHNMLLRFELKCQISASSALYWHNGWLSEPTSMLHLPHPGGCRFSCLTLSAGGIERFYIYGRGTSGILVSFRARSTFRPNVRD